MTKKYAVLGQPISHSKSPAIHRAIFEKLGVDSSYEAFELGEGLADFLQNHNDFAGFSVTMPLKDHAFELSQILDEAAKATSSVNTLLKTPTGWAGFNTDVFGLTQSLLNTDISNSLVLGTGATARSAIYALQKMGSKVSIWGRDSAKAVNLQNRFSLAIEAEIANAANYSAVISTLPAGSLDHYLNQIAEPSGTLLDISYYPWPSAAASHWLKRGKAISGLEMLIWQAIGQQRIFAGQPPESPLPDEVKLVAAARAAVSVAQ